jgi:hypothetical protein
MLMQTSENNDSDSLKLSNSKYYSSEIKNYIPLSDKVKFKLHLHSRIFNVQATKTQYSIVTFGQLSKAFTILMSMFPFNNWSAYSLDNSKLVP